MIVFCSAWIALHISCLVPEDKSETQEIIFGRSFFKFFEITFNEKDKTTTLKKLST